MHKSLKLEIHRVMCLRAVLRSFERKQILRAAAKARDMPGHREFGNRRSYSLGPALRHRDHVLESFLGQNFAQRRPHRSQ